MERQDTIPINEITQLPIIFPDNLDTQFESYKPELSQLAKEDIQKIAIANPRLAPFGFASHHLLKNMTNPEEIKPKIVMLENISQVTQVAKLGSVDAAFIARSHSASLAEENGSCILELAPTSYPPIQQQLVILKRTKEKKLAHKFINFIFSKKSQNLIKNMGYSIPASDKIAE